MGQEAMLSERAQHLFRVLVQRYIGSGQPVGSRTLSRDSGLDLSPATVRNVMADLEDLGLLRSPHVSAGRVPTVQGYRFFVDSLLNVAPIDEGELEHLRIQLELKGERESLMDAATSLISDVTHMAGIVTLPKQERLILRHVEFLALSPERVLVILVVNGSDVQNRVIHLARPYSQALLQQVGNYLNEVCAGKDLLEVRESLLAELKEHRSSLDALMLTAIEMADKAFVKDVGGEEALLVSGQTNLMGYGELADMEKLRHLFEAFREKTELLHILDQCVRADGLQIFIGEESGFEVLDGCSVIAAPYEREGKVLGVLGVIGPTRMAYDRVIPIVDVTARLLGAALNQHH
ncbi:MAG: heat-inducible transcriptional repressor HrcA [Thiotrichales bacterium]|nr:heat-inducible transcriptional repressor HrcA [Thiotrichales bacterium]